MKNKSLTVIIILLIISLQPSIAGERPKNISLIFSDFINDSVALPTGPSPVNEAERVREAELTSRRTTATIYSCILPGSGQTMLGHTYKGVGFTMLAFGSALTAGISHNNFVARNERLDALEFNYANATTWENADAIYIEMRRTHSQLQRDKNRRDIFLVVSAVVWISNIIDIMYFTEDQGQSLFSSAKSEQPLQIGTIDSPHKPLLSLSLPF